jgi:hypothetical protein
MENFMKALKNGDEESCIHILKTENTDIHKKDSQEHQYLLQKWEY